MLALKLTLIAILTISINSSCTYNYSNPNTDWPLVTCTTGTTNACNTTTSLKQSPINVLRASVDYPASNLSTKVSVDYDGAGSLKIKNVEHTQKVEITKGGLTVNGIRYDLAQWHWHQPAEHTFDGHYYDAELHFVHTTTDTTAVQQYLVIAVYFQIGDENEWLKKNKFASLQATKDTYTSLSDTINPWDIIKPAASAGILEYSGSFTTPPCTEGVTFLLTRVPQTMTMAQWEAFKTSLASYVTMVYTNGTGNIRPVQALNTRVVSYRNYEFEDEHDWHFHMGSIIGVVLGGLAFVVIIIVIIKCCCCKKDEGSDGKMYEMTNKN